MELVLHDILMNIVLRLKVNTFQFFTGFMPHCIDRPQPKVVVENFDGNKWEESMEMKGADISKRSKQWNPKFIATFMLELKHKYANIYLNSGVMFHIFET